MMATGNPGFGGGTRWDFMASALKYGPSVTLSTDTGHVGKPNNITFAVNNPDGAIDWAYRSLHESTVLGKQLAKAYYGNDIQHAYYTACSNGGRQGLKEVQMFPGDYDGVVVGAPPWWITHLHPWALQLGIWNLPANEPHHISTSKFSIIADAFLEQCDAQDGLVDQIIMQPYSCNFSADALLCDSSTTNTSTCLTKPQIDTLSLLYNDWQDGNGSLIFPRFPLSASASRFAGVETAPDHFGLEYMYGFVYSDTDWDWTTFKGEETVEFVDSLNTADAAALSFDLSEFRDNGGKMILYHGLADPTIPTASSVYYYQNVNETMFPDGSTSGAIEDFFQFYEIPGMKHCGESDVAPYFIAAAGQVVITDYGNSFSVPGFSDPQHDVLLAMMNWVENGTAPAELIASKWNNNTLENGLLMQRPICPYPQHAVYSGQGDWHEPSTWSCQGGTYMEFPTPNGTVGTVKAMDNLTMSCGEFCDATAPTSTRPIRPKPTLNGANASKQIGWSIWCLQGLLVGALMIL